jgi:hypothetical protein
MIVVAWNVVVVEVEGFLDVPIGVGGWKSCLGGKRKEGEARLRGFCAWARAWGSRVHFWGGIGAVDRSSTVRLKWTRGAEEQRSGKREAGGPGIY